jgi:hypothetical protein
MSAIAAEPSKGSPGNGTKINRALPTRRDPVWVDYLLFFLGIPVAMGFVFSLVGTKLTNGMPYLDSLFYMNIHLLTAWLPVCLGAYIIKFSFRNWQPPLIAVCLIGLLIALIPAAFLFQKLGDLYASMYPVYAANRVDDSQPGWTLDYLLHFIRYSMPILPVFLAGVYSYRAVMGVDWFGYKSPRLYIFSNPESPLHIEKKICSATASLIEGTQLPKEAELLAIKAEQHYIQIWSDQGTDLVRFRFRDLAKTLEGCNGAQVHRSWWVNLDQVQSCRQAGRKLELIVNDELIIPVSLSYKNAVLNSLKQESKNL